MCTYTDTLEKRKTSNFDLFFECRGLLEKKKQVIIKATSVNISRVYFSNLNHTIPNIVSMPILPFYYKLNQKCLYSADLRLVEFQKIWDFLGI